MAKKATITPVADTVNNASAINTQLNAINNQLDNTLSLDGSTPNAMNADIDLNNNDILNAKNIYSDEVTVGGIPLASNVAAAAASATSASTSATAASLSATQAALYEGVWVDDVDSLLADTALTYTAGQLGTVVAGGYVRTRSEGFSYEVAASGAVDQHVTTAGGVKLYVFGVLNVKAFGAVGDGVTDDTVAFETMWAYFETLPVLIATNANFRALFHRGAPEYMYIPAGEYVVTRGWKPNSSSGREAAMRGDGPQFTIIQMPVDGTAEYLVEFLDRTSGGTPYLNAYYNLDIRGIKLVGGKGLFFNAESNASFVQRGVNVEDTDILGFTAIGVGSLWGDDPRWNFQNVIIETTAPNTKGLYLPPGVANPTFNNVTIIGCTYRVVTAASHQGTGFISGLTMFSLSTDDHEADFWFKTIDPLEANDGRGLIVSGNRLSSENRGGKPVVLIADGDGIGAQELQRHATTTSVRRFRDWKMVGNTITGAGTADDPVLAGPLIRSYTADLGRLQVRDNSINVAFTKILDLVPDPTIGKPGEMQLGPNQFVGTGEIPEFCNRDVGHWSHGDGTETGGTSTPLLSGGLDAAYKIVSLTAGGAAHSTGTATYSTTAAVAATDPIGMSDSRSLVFSSAASYMEIISDATQLAASGLNAGENYWVEFEAQRTGATLQLTEVDVEVFITSASGGRTWRWHYRPTVGWRRNRFAFQCNEVPLTMRLRIMPSPENWAASRDRTRVARPVIYRASRPQSRDPHRLPIFGKSALSAGGVEGDMVYCSDAAGGKTPVFYDGVNWRNVWDRVILS